MNINKKQLQALLDIAENSSLSALASLLEFMPNEMNPEEDALNCSLIFIEHLRHELGISKIDSWQSRQRTITTIQPTAQARIMNRNSPETL